ncbi:hypothetical protein GBA52_016546 [Prunus armeniaca]|nr:hypothetical protein GBA52_016546 [Prunus armeniaca]
MNKHAGEIGRKRKRKFYLINSPYTNGKKEQGGKRHLDNKVVNKGKEIGVVPDGAKGEEHTDKKKLSGLLSSPRTPLCEGLFEKAELECNYPLGEDAIEQPVLEVIEVFVDMFAMERLKIFIDASLVHGGTIRDDFSIYVDVLDEFDFKLAYMSTRHKDFEESENPEAKEEPQWKDEPVVESKVEIVVISSDDEQEPMEESKIKVILIELSDDKFMEEINGELVQKEPRDVHMNEGEACSDGAQWKQDKVGGREFWAESRQPGLWHSMGSNAQNAQQNMASRHAAQ